MSAVSKEETNREKEYARTAELTRLRFKTAMSKKGYSPTLLVKLLEKEGLPGTTAYEWLKKGVKRRPNNAELFLAFLRALDLSEEYLFSPATPEPIAATTLTEITLEGAVNREILLQDPSDVAEKVRYILKSKAGPSFVEIVNSIYTGVKVAEITSD